MIHVTLRYIFGEPSAYGMNQFIQLQGILHSIAIEVIIENTHTS
jgi:hypothetical protein